MFALKHFLVYLISGKHFVIYKNHQALQTAFKKKYTHGRLLCVLDLIIEYDLEVKYSPRSSSGAADFLFLRHIQKEGKKGYENLTEEFFFTL